ncbi:MAG: RNA polymerase sigma-70 factor (ECF subfamily) [Myxococcota bacterium]|jgi:RNA polymerase sigma-70 factor (ECF subfamily)
MMAAMVEPLVPQEARFDLDDLYRRYGPMVLRRVRRFVGPSEAEDVRQEIFLRAAERSDSFRNESSPATWLYALATNYCINKVRDWKRRRELLAERGPSVFQAHTHASQEAAAFLNDIWRRLDPELAEIGIYYYVDGMTTEKIGRLLGCSDRTIANRLKAIRRQASGEKA